MAVVPGGEIPHLVGQRCARCAAAQVIEKAMFALHRHIENPELLPGLRFDAAGAHPRRDRQLAGREQENPPAARLTCFAVSVGSRLAGAVDQGVSGLVEALGVNLAEFVEREERVRVQ